MGDSMFVIMGAIALAATPSATPRPPAQSLGESLASVRSFARGPGEALWPGYGSAPFEFLLVEATKETLLCRTAVPDGFKAAGRDENVDCRRFVRDRTSLSDTLLAAMPLFGPPPTIVMGNPKTTNRTPASWLRTILHEHFHQWQFSLPDYFKRTDALDLKGGDTTGMWVLTYPFPYAKPEVIALQSAASNALADAVDARGTSAFAARLAAYLEKRDAFRGGVSEKDWRYIEFQLWQEGVARWTEIQLGKAYPDESVVKSAELLEQRTIEALRKPDLKNQEREFVYAYGASEAMLLAACGPKWRTHYPLVMQMGALLDEARKACAHPL